MYTNRKGIDKKREGFIHSLFIWLYVHNKHKFNINSFVALSFSLFLYATLFIFVNTFVLSGTCRADNTTVPAIEQTTKEQPSKVGTDSSTDSQTSPSESTSPAQLTYPIFSLPPENTINGRQKLYNRLAELEVHGQGFKCLDEATEIVIRLTRPALVHIETILPMRNPQPTSNNNAGQFNNESGSGFIINYMNRFYVVTNSHVIHASAISKTPQRVNIYLQNGQMIHPVKILSDSMTDVALLELSGSYLSLPLGNSDLVKPGRKIITAGSPFGLKYSFSDGIVSAVGRRNLSVGKTSPELQNYIQTNAVIHPGNSGGPLLNIQGEVIGINAAIASNSGFGEGISFAIPSNQLSFIIEQLATTGKVNFGWIGASFDPSYSINMAVTLGVYSALFTNQNVPVYPPRSGARLIDCPINSPAALAGLKGGDIILYFDKTIVEDANHLKFLIRMTRPGTTVPIIYFRNGKLFDYQIQVGQKP